MLFLRENVNMLHLLHNGSLTPKHIRRRILAAEFNRIRQGGSNQSTVGPGQMKCRTREMELGYCFCAIDAISHLYTVQINLHDTPLTPNHFYQTGEICLKPLTTPAMTWPKKDVLCGLLTDSAGSTITLTATAFIYCNMYFFEIEAVMGQETLILAGHHSNWHIYGHRVQGHPMMTHTDGLPTTNLLHTTNCHQGCNQDRTPLV